VLRDCPNCEQGKHAICTEQVIAPGIPMLSGVGYFESFVDDDDNWVPCPCAEREHTTLVKFVPVDEKDDEVSW
jgi:hypothetical protein